MIAMPFEKSHMIAVALKLFLPQLKLGMLSPQGTKNDGGDSQC